MIHLTCTNCHAQLAIDDAFAGGVCRCRHCGAIQTVPSHLKQKSAAAATAAAPAPKKPAKTLYQQPGIRTDASKGSGLNELADVVASSGLTSGRLRAANVPGAMQRVHLSPRVAVGAAVGVLVFLGLLLWLFSGEDPPPPNRAGPSLASAASAAPTFCGVPIEQQVVVYALDRGSATADVFGWLKEACYRSAESLGPQRKFQIIFWDNGSGEAVFPTAGPTFANRANLDAARRALDEVAAHGQSDPLPALARAMRATPGAIVLATGKGYELDDAFAQRVLEVRGSSPVTIHTFAVGSGEPGAALKTLASKTGGRFAVISPAELRDAAE